jgi:hypothetical protein
VFSYCLDQLARRAFETHQTVIDLIAATYGVREGRVAWAVLQSSLRRSCRTGNAPALNRASDRPPKYCLRSVSHSTSERQAGAVAIACVRSPRTSSATRTQVL